MIRARCRPAAKWALGTILAVLLVAASPTSLTVAQTSTGEIDITILDRTGAVIPRAQVTITGAEMGNLVRRLATNAEGIASAPVLPPETYDIVVDMPGFKKLVRNGIVLRVGEVLNLQLQLEAGTPTQSVTVVGHTPVLEQKSASLTQVMEQKDILQLPLNGRNYLDLANLAAGAIPSHGSRDQTFCLRQLRDTECVPARWSPQRELLARP